jgi:hypothetical protein
MINSPSKLKIFVAQLIEDKIVMQNVCLYCGKKD